MASTLKAVAVIMNLETLSVFSNQNQATLLAFQSADQIENQTKCLGASLEKKKLASNLSGTSSFKRTYFTFFFKRIINKQFLLFSTTAQD